MCSCTAAKNKIQLLTIFIFFYLRTNSLYVLGWGKRCNGLHSSLAAFVIVDAASFIQQSTEKICCHIKFLTFRVLPLSTENEIQLLWRFFCNYLKLVCLFGFWVEESFATGLNNGCVCESWIWRLLQQSRGKTSSASDLTYSLLKWAFSNY